MRRQILWCSGVAGLFVLLSLSSVSSRAGVFDHFWGESGPPSLADVARMIDHIQSSLLNQGSVVVKQPDVWSQARMTMFRKEFEKTMQPEVDRFKTYISARIARSDQAALSSQTALGASLSPAPGVDTQLKSLTAIQGERDSAVDLLGESTGALATFTTPSASSGVTQTFSLLGSLAPKGNSQITNGALTSSALDFGLEPNVYLDQKADYINHLHRIRRVNLGDDNADSAGYGLYLMRVPVSIQPGDKTKKGFGAIASMTMRHDFGPKFLQNTYRNLVINDVIDMLAPTVTEAIRTNSAQQFHDLVKAHDLRKLNRQDNQYNQYNNKYMSRNSTGQITDEESYDRELQDLANKCKPIRYSPVSRIGSRSFPIAPSDLIWVFLPQNLLLLAYETQTTLDLSDPESIDEQHPKVDKNKVRAADVRAYLRQELESAYDLMSHDAINKMDATQSKPSVLQDIVFIEELTDKLNRREFDKATRKDFNDEYTKFAKLLPGNVEETPIGVLSWAIAIEAGLLNRHLREDMKQVKGANDYICPPDVDSLFCYPPEPTPETATAFQEYVKARWPMTTFALEPVTDQQNIDDAFTRRRDLQLSIAFALASGRISFRQATQYTRQLQYEAQTIALNQTVISFAHGTDTFGWQFRPRYQTPPEENNFQAVTNLLLGGGPGPNYQLANSKIEPGMRELTAVVIMPSFVQGMRLDVSGDWFRLIDPDERKLRTARTIEFGRRINEARDALDAACKCGKYRPEDTERLRIRLHELERMLPIQTQFVKVPYENTLGGFALFTEGTTALVPELTGFEGIEYLDIARPVDIIVYGKHFNIHETSVVVGGVSLAKQGDNRIVSAETGGTLKMVPFDSSMRDSNGNIVVLNADKSTTLLRDSGCYDILSREVMRVRIPANVKPAKRGDGTEVVELYVSTPNGISNRLQIPLPPPPPQVAAVPRSTVGYIMKGDPITIEYSYNLNAAAEDAPGTIEKIATKDTITIQPKVLNTVNPDPVNVEFAFALSNGEAITPKTKVVAAFDPKAQGYQVKIADIADKLLPVARKLFSGRAADSSISTTSITVQPGGTVPQLVLVGDTLDTKLTVNFKYSAVTTPLPPVDGRPQDLPGGELIPSLDPLPRTRQSNLNLERRSSSKLDPMTNRASHARSAFAANTMAQGDGGIADAPNSVPQPSALPRRNPVAVAADQVANTNTPTPIAQPLVIVPPSRAPTVNVNVPITNQIPEKHRRSFFRRQNSAPQPASPAASARGPLLERLMGRP